jgi:NADH:quinone reductase (non-electrogenic)
MPPSLQVVKRSPTRLTSATESWVRSRTASVRPIQSVELAGAIAQLAHLTLASEFRRFDPTSLRIILIEAGPRVLPPFHESLGAATKAKLERMGVEVWTRKRVDKVDAEGVIVAGERIRSKTIFWAAGVKPSPAATWLGAEADKAGRVKVLPD